MVEIRKMDNGDTVVDFGGEWFRIRPDGSAIKKWGSKGSVNSRAATPTERKKIWALAFPTWSTDDCIDVTLIWLRQKRDQLDVAIGALEKVKSFRVPSPLPPAERGGTENAQ